MIYRQYDFRLENVAEQVSKYYRIEISDMQKDTRKQPIAEARQVFFYMASVYTKCTFSQIGSYVGRDHSSVTAGIKKITDLETVYSSVIMTISEIKNMMFQQGARALIPEHVDLLELIKNYTNSFIH